MDWLKRAPSSWLVVVATTVFSIVACVPSQAVAVSADTSTSIGNQHNSRHVYNSIYNSFFKKVQNPSMRSTRTRRRKLIALPGFMVGTTDRGMDVTRNGAVTDWTKWDLEKSWAKAGQTSNTFHVWYDPRGATPGETFNFTISSAGFSNSSSNPNEAACSISSVTPALGTPIVASNVSTPVTVSYTCTEPGQSLVELTFEAAGYDNMDIRYFKTNGNALTIGTTVNGSDVVYTGITQPAFSGASPAYTVAYATDQTTFHLVIPGALLPHTGSEPRTSDFSVATAPNDVVDVVVSGSATTGLPRQTSIGHQTLELVLSYTCKAEKDLANTVISVSVAMAPFSPIAFSFTKDCSNVIGFDMIQLASGGATAHDVIKDGAVVPTWMQDHFYSSLTGNLDFQLVSTKESIPMKAPVVSASTNVCTAALSGPASIAITLTSTPTTFTLGYTCAAGSQGMQNNSILLDFGAYGTVSFSVTKFFGYRPSFDVKLQNRNITADGSLLPAAVVQDGIGQSNWSSTSTNPYILPPRVGVLSMWASVATGIPFQLGAPFQAVESSSSHHAGQCDPHIRPNPADAYWIGADGMEIEISFWCTQNTGLDVARFDATFLDSNEYLTTTFAFRKTTHVVEDFALTANDGVVMFQGGKAVNGWSSTGNSSLELNYTDASTATTSFDIDNTGATVITKVDVLPFPNSGTGCNPTAKLDAGQTSLTIDYGCTPPPDAPKDGPAEAVDIDIIVVLHVHDPGNPSEEYTPPMVNWMAKVTYDATPESPSSDILTWILVSAGAVVLIVIIAVFATRLARRKDRSSSFDASVREPMLNPVQRTSGPISTAEGESEEEDSSDSEESSEEQYPADGATGTVADGE